MRLLRSDIFVQRLCGKIIKIYRPPNLFHLVLAFIRLPRLSVLNDHIEEFHTV